MENQDLDKTYIWVRWNIVFLTVWEVPQSTTGKQTIQIQLLLKPYVYSQTFEQHVYIKKAGPGFFFILHAMFYQTWAQKNKF